MAKYKDGAHRKGSFFGGINMYLNLITREDIIDIPSILQSYVLHWYHKYLLHPGMDITEDIICEHLY